MRASKCAKLLHSSLMLRYNYICIKLTITENSRQMAKSRTTSKDRSIGNMALFKYSLEYVICYEKINLKEINPERRSSPYAKFPSLHWSYSNFSQEMCRIDTRVKIKS